MGWIYTDADIQLIKHARIKFAKVDDKLVVKGYKDQKSAGESIEFQFPPKITTDSRKGNWNEGEMRGDEPVAVFATSGPRELTMSWTYVVDTLDGDSSNAWTIERIAKNIKNLRGYFARVRDEGSDRENLLIRFKIWHIGGESDISARIKSIDVKYGETMVFPRGDHAHAFPLRSDVTVDMRVWTYGGDVEIKENDQDLPQLDKPSPDWY